LADHKRRNAHWFSSKKEEEMHKLIYALGFILTFGQSTASASIRYESKLDMLVSAQANILSLNAAQPDTVDTAGVEPAPGARNGADAVRLFSTGRKAAIYNQPTQAALKGTVSFYYKATSSAVKGQNLVFYVIPFTSEDKEGGAARTAWTVPKETVGDGQWHKASFKFDYSRDLSVVGVQLDPRVNETTATGAGDWMISGIELHPQTYSTAPRLSVQAFCGSEAPIVKGKPFNLVLTVSNQGRTAAKGLRLYLHTSANIKKTSNPSLPAALPPNSSHTFVWRCSTAGNIQSAWADFKLSSTNALLTEGKWSSVILSQSADKWPAIPGGILIGNSQVRLVFPRLKINGENIWTICSIQRRSGHIWRTIAILPHMVQVETTKDLCNLPPFGMLLSRSAKSVRFLFKGAMWNVLISIGIVDPGDTIKIDSKLTAKKDIALLAFRCPDLRIGEGTFGSKKHDAIFPGLEFLNAKQRSSSAEFINPPDSERWTPDPLRITMPLMSAAADGSVITLTWDANMRWDGKHEGCSAQFASPNLPMKQNNTRMALFVPTIPDWVNENGVKAGHPYFLQKGRTLSLNSKILVQAGKSALEGVKTVEQRWGKKWHIALAPRSIQEEISLCANSYLNVLWRGLPAGWMPTTGWQPNPDPGICLQLLKMAQATSDSELASQMQQRVRSVVDAVHNNHGDVNLALWTGDVEAALATARNVAYAEMKSQRSDGTWGFDPDTKDRERLGPRGAANAGICATNLRPIAYYALVTGDPNAVQSLLKGLKAMEKFDIPAGGQVWECPLGEPDIYAAAVAIPVTLAGYQITGDRKYLDEAIHWAWTGVPFVYQWHRNDRPIMLGGTTAVFGSTFFTWSWMGRPVQWNGLAYAGSLLSLAPYDSSFDWKRLAASITHCGMQEESIDDPSMAGCYPDSYHLLSNKPADPWLQPAAILSNLFQLNEGTFAYPNTVVFANGHSRWVITSGAPVSGKANAGSLHLTVTPRKEIVTRMFFPSAAPPSKILIDGQPLPEVSPDEHADGWSWDAVDRVTLMQISSPNPFQLIISK
jgi:hypothetical protein